MSGLHSDHPPETGTFPADGLQLKEASSKSVENVPSPTCATLPCPSLTLCSLSPHSGLLLVLLVAGDVVEALVVLGAVLRGLRRYHWEDSGKITCSGESHRFMMLPPLCTLLKVLGMGVDGRQHSMEGWLLSHAETALASLN